MLSRMAMPLLGAIAALLAAGPVAGADPITKLEPPKTAVVLTISGNIAVTNSDKGARFDRETLNKIGVKTVTTATPWTEGKPKFTGVLLSDLLKAIGAKGAKVTAIALDNYSFAIPVEDAEKYPVLLAMEMNGTVMTAKDKGPIWVVYPRDDFPELNNRNTDRRMVWQVKELIVE
ncbi:MAG: molybdopterin-dependent oxidoreductase [Devosia sp.]